MQKKLSPPPSEGSPDKQTQFKRSFPQMPEVQALLRISGVRMSQRKLVPDQTQEEAPTGASSLTERKFPPLPQTKLKKPPRGQCCGMDSGICDSSRPECEDCDDCSYDRAVQLRGE